MMDYLLKQENTDLIIEQEKTRIKKEIIGQYISLRKERKLSQEDIAGTTGIARSNIARIESGKNVPTIEVLTKLAFALNMDLEIKFVEKQQEL
ncbi:MAG: helix-turn-helix transcriptional regulator [Lachnospiraceae bacterium]|nr:helix-turn-helix transcriptional regulator [Lachnospiraceae bacterium]